MLRFFIDCGKVEVSKLSLISRYFNEDNRPISDGIEPLILFSDSAKFESFKRDIKVEGIVPEMLLLVKANASKLARLPQDEGIVPSKEQFARIS